MDLLEVARLVRVRAASPPRARRDDARRGELTLRLELNGFEEDDKTGRMGSFSDMAKEKWEGGRESLRKASGGEGKEGRSKMGLGGERKEGSQGAEEVG